VLVDWDRRYLYRKLFDDEEEMGRFLDTVCTLEWNRDLDRGRPFAEAVAALSAEHPEWRAEIEAYHRRWVEMLAGPVEGTERLVRELHRRGVALYALTNFAAETFALTRQRFELLHLFKEVVVSGEEGVVKPEREIYEILVRRTGVAPARTVFIDDTPENVRAAEQLGFEGIRFSDAAGLERSLTRLGLL
jgi:2-haloacid dehalogenase